MATDKTTVVSARVPQETADALAKDAEDSQRSTGAHLRALLEERYLAEEVLIDAATSSAGAGRPNPDASPALNENAPAAR